MTHFTDFQVWSAALVVTSLGATAVWFLFRSRSHTSGMTEGDDHLLLEVQRVCREQYPDRELLTWGPPPRRLPARRVLIVTLLHATDSIPPERSWWRVSDDDGRIDEISLEVAATYIQIPTWR